MKQIAKDHNFAISKSEYQKNKELYLGAISDFTSVIRISLTKRKNSFDLYMVMNILGKDMVNKRLFNSINYLQKRK